MTLQIKLISAIFALVVMDIAIIGNIAASFTLCMLGNFLLLLSSADFFKIIFFKKRSVRNAI